MARITIRTTDMDQNQRNCIKPAQKCARQCGRSDPRVTNSIGEQAQQLTTYFIFCHQCLAGSAARSAQVRVSR